MSGLLEDFEQQFAQITAEITSSIGKLSNVEINDRRNLIIEINQKIDEAQELVIQRHILDIN
jgi:hypothetical protein